MPRRNASQVSRLACHESTFPKEPEGTWISIWRYSFEQWSKTQADEYYLALRNQLKAALANPDSGVPVTIRPGHRKLLSGSHFIYYRAVDDGIEIIRVLHQNMDVRRHL
ncbi:type II toxin-antitoxin system RelE/ParE family toxin [Devosia ginsengisoli]|uniref:type II toxin-antitoxin system RelE/ParE family toxin n=1 Tax=Devosia ginsengisoli TaxID=400770 RepID=UPI0034E9732F